MLFVEFRFFAFFLVVFSVHWALRNNTARKLWLLLCSHFFYACFFIGDPVEFYGFVRSGNWTALNAAHPGWWFPTVLWASSVMDYVVGLGIADSPRDSGRKAWLLVSLCVNLGVLCFFKYYNFFVGSASSFLTWFGLP